MKEDVRDILTIIAERGLVYFALTVAILVLLVLVSLYSAKAACAADITFTWDPSEGATGYRVYRTLDLGVTWEQLPGEVTSGTEYTAINQEEDQLILYRVGAFNAQGEAIRWEAGAWYHGMWKPPANPSGAGIQ